MTLDPFQFDITEPHFEAFFQVDAMPTTLSRVRGFAPEFKGSHVVLPVEFTAIDGATWTVGFSMDVEHLRAMLEEYDATHAFPDVIE